MHPVPASTEEPVKIMWLCTVAPVRQGSVAPLVRRTLMSVYPHHVRMVAHVRTNPAVINVLARLALADHLVRWTLTTVPTTLVRTMELAWTRSMAMIALANQALQVRLRQ